MTRLAVVQQNGNAIADMGIDSLGIGKFMRGQQCTYLKIGFHHAEKLAGCVTSKPM